VSLRKRQLSMKSDSSAATLFRHRLNRLVLERPSRPIAVGRSAKESVSRASRTQRSSTLSTSHSLVNHFRFQPLFNIKRDIPHLHRHNNLFKSIGYV
jgi:hypothetical protein